MERDKRVFGLNVKGQRVRRGWNQDEFAAMLGVSQAAVSRIESGESCPAMTMLNVGDVLNMSIEELWESPTGEPANEPTPKDQD